MTCIVRFDISCHCEYCNPSVDVISVSWVDTQGVKRDFVDYLQYLLRTNSLIA